LESGTITITVRKQLAEERFLVVLPDGEIEVRGTRFEVTVNNALTRSVRVFEGVVALRRAASDERVLRANDTWSLDEPARTASASPSTASPLPSVRVATSTAPTASPAAATEAEYAAAMTAFRTQSWAAAARRFGAFAAAHPNAPEVEDAAFLQASALAHAGRADDAAATAERFLASYPRSFHARDAAILVARAARDRGDCERARAVLAKWHGPEIDAALARCAAE
jgi:TolA-binding protein